MGAHEVNTEKLHIWYLLDEDDAALTGLAGTMSCTLIRSTGAAQAAAAEVVTIAEIGATGVYAITYTPEYAQTYMGLVEESTTASEYVFEDEVTDVLSTATADKAYCAEADVVSFAQMGGYGVTTTPTENEVLNFMEMRAAQIYSMLHKYMGSSTPGPTGYSLTIDTTTDAGLALARVTKLANALGAAMDALEAAGAGESPQRSERVQELGVAFNGAMDMLSLAAMTYLGDTNRASTHISEGEVTVPTTTAYDQQGLIWTDRTDW